MRSLDPDVGAERAKCVVPAGVIEVEVGRDDGVDVVGCDAKLGQPRNGVVSGCDVALGRIPGLAVCGADQRGRIAGVDQVPLPAGRDDQIAGT